jgi:hypothetical protein
MRKPKLFMWMLALVGVAASLERNGERGIVLS